MHLAEPYSEILFRVGIQRLCISTKFLGEVDAAMHHTMETTVLE